MRKEIAAFADFNGREMVEVENPHLLVYCHFDHLHASSSVLVIANFDASPQYLDLDVARRMGFRDKDRLIDLQSSNRPLIFNDKLVVPAFGFYWLGEQ